VKWIALSLAWIATLAVAVVVGREIAPRGPVELADGAGNEETSRLRRENEDLRKRVELLRVAGRAEDPIRRPAEPGRLDDDAAGGGGVRAAPAADDDSPIAMDGALPSIEGVASAHELSALLMRFVDRELAKGPEGYRTLLRALAAIPEQEKTLERFFRDEATAFRELYPWVKFLVEREEQVLDVTEFVFRTMAEEPSFFEGMDDNPFEVFTEGVAVLLPGAVPPERLERFRAHARKILAQPRDSYPDPIKDNWSDIKRALTRYWSEPVSTDEALEKLRAGGLDGGQALKLLSTLTPEQLRGIDVTALLAPALATGQYDAIRALRSLPPVPLDLNRLDATVLGAMQGGTANGWFARSYLEATRRNEWAKVRPFVESALASNEKARDAAVDTIIRLPGSMRPSKDEVRDLLARYEIPEARARRLKGSYGIE
jgi:hypothetical protein